MYDRNTITIKLHIIVLLRILIVIYEIEILSIIKCSIEVVIDFKFIFYFCYHHSYYKTY